MMHAPPKNGKEIQREKNRKRKECDDHDGISKTLSVTSANNDTTAASYPLRPLLDEHPLYAYAATIACANNDGCVPCGYKIGAFDVALDEAFCTQVPNQRPETCPRLKNRTAAVAAMERDTTTTESTPTTDLRILLVGDGDLTFSLALARQGYAVVATSYESQTTLEQVYGSGAVTTTVGELQQSHSATVEFQVDATRLQDTLPASVLRNTTTTSPTQFDRIVWNFPCSAIADGQDGQNQDMETNKQLIRDFLQSARPLLRPTTGQIHLLHKTKPPYDQWNLPHIVGESDDGAYTFLGRIVLDRSLFPPYVPRKALDRKSFPCHDACTYVFGLRSAPLVDVVPVTAAVISDIRTHLLAVAVARRRSPRRASQSTKRKRNNRRRK